MKKRTKSKIISIIIIVIIILVTITFVIFYKHTTKIVYNSDNSKGNTACNLLNNGTFCESDKGIYFNNPNDKGALYFMDYNLDNYKKICNDYAMQINCVGKYIYYSRANNLKGNYKQNVLGFSNVGVYRINKDGTKTFKLYDDAVGVVNIYGNYVYYQHYSKKNNIELYMIKIDGEEEKRLSRDPIVPACIEDGSMYFCGVSNDHYIHSKVLSTGAETIVYEGNCHNCVLIDGYFYFMDMENDYAIARVKQYDNNVEIVVNKRCATYNITQDGQYLFYQVDDGKNNGIYRMNMYTLEESLIKSGNFKEINIVGKKVIFKDFKLNQLYYLDTYSSSDVLTLNPPIIED